MIAIGAAKVMGFQLMENFNTPYFAVGIRDFWGRWHISLSTWFRDYLYIPLGGNRRGKFRKAVQYYDRIPDKRPCGMGRTGALCYGAVFMDFIRCSRM